MTSKVKISEDLPRVRAEWEAAKTTTQAAHAALEAHNHKPATLRDVYEGIGCQGGIRRSKRAEETVQWCLGEHERLARLFAGDADARCCDPRLLVADFDALQQRLEAIDPADPVAAAELKATIRHETAARIKAAADAHRRIVDACAAAGSTGPEGYQWAPDLLGGPIPEPIKQSAAMREQSHRCALNEAGKSPAAAQWDEKIADIEQQLAELAANRQEALEAQEAAEAEAEEDRRARAAERRARDEAQRKDAERKSKKLNSANAQRRAEIERLAAAYRQRQGRPVPHPTPVEDGTPSDVQGGPPKERKADTL